MQKFALDKAMISNNKLITVYVRFQSQTAQSFLSFRARAWKVYVWFKGDFTINHERGLLLNSDLH